MSTCVSRRHAERSKVSWGQSSIPFALSAFLKRRFAKTKTKLHRSRKAEFIL